MGYSWDTWAEQGTPAATEGEMNLKSGVLRSTDGGKTWHPGGDLYADFKKTSPHATWGLGEPATVLLADGRILSIMRSGATKAYQSWSSDGGLTWTTPVPGELTEHNSPVALWRLDNSKDIFLVYDNSPTGRTPLAVALSSDGGETWSAPRTLVDTGGPQASYPSAVQAADGTLIAVWQQDLGKGKREIKIARFNRAWLTGK
jgi:predicted neuraminidase